MPSNRQNEANRRNAQLSTGPKTRSGKLKSSGNARRHGLSSPAARDESKLVAITKALVDADISHSQSVDPTDVVCAKLELNRIRDVRHALLTALLNVPDLATARRLQNLQRYERLAYAKQRRALRATSSAKLLKTFN